MRVTVTLLITLLLVLSLSQHAAADRGVYIIVTFPSLAQEVEQLLCKGDRVDSIVPPSVDPHEYQLSPNDIVKLESADLIISTGHAPFEKRIEELVEKGDISAKLVVIWRVPGVRLVENPVTGRPNLHMPIYDPRNYIAFVKVLATELERLRPECASVYREKAAMIISSVEALLENAPRLDVDAVADTPVVQYAVEWLGVRVRIVLVPEPGMPTQPVLYDKSVEVLEDGGVAVVTKPVKSPASQELVRLAESRGAPVILVPSPSELGTIPEKLAFIVNQIRDIQKRGWVAASANLVPEVVKWFLVVGGASLAFGVLSVVVAARRLYFLAAGLPHSSLLAATLAIPISMVVGGPEYLWAALIAVGMVHAFSVLVEKGIDPDVAASVYVSATASASVAVMYYVLTRFPLQAGLWAYILGDPLLVGMEDVLVALVVAALVGSVVILTYREQVCIGLDPSSVRLAGLRVKLYDVLFISVLAAASVLLLRTVGFVVEHVMILLPGAIASTIARGMWKTLVLGVLVSLTAGIAGLALAITAGVAPAAAIGGLLVGFYVAALAARR
ncbi:metal ABC transporter solute-binding protein, Zn/Mn family [Pyrolobus fumarii]|nr:metal ABC transporter permease [Pyrolobus fumarii]